VAAALVFGSLGVTFAQDDLVRGTWRGTLTSQPGQESPLVVTIAPKGDGYAGSVTGFGEVNAVPLEQVVVSGSTVTFQASADSKLGVVTLTGDVTVQGTAMKGTGTIGVGTQRLPVTLQLTRRPRMEIEQPTVEQRMEYFLGRWTFDYLGGEFPPLRAGTRSGKVAFVREGTSAFMSAQIDGDLAGKPYQERWSIGFDPATNMLVFQERRPDGSELVSLANWRSPLAITFTTRPQPSGGRMYQLRRVLSVTSDAAFDVTEEFSVDGGPFRRLGRARFTKVP
jgi:hypothetical protein